MRTASPTSMCKAFAMSAAGAQGCLRRYFSIALRARISVHGPALERRGSRGTLTTTVEGAVRAGGSISGAAAWGRNGGDASEAWAVPVPRGTREVVEARTIVK